MNSLIKILLTIICLLLVTASSFAQGLGTFRHSHHVSATIMGIDDFSSEPYPLVGANVQMEYLNDSTSRNLDVTDENGKILCRIFTKNKIKDFKVKVHVSYVGMEPFDTIVPIKNERLTPNFVTQSASVGTVILRSKPVTTEEAVIIGELKKLYASGDTVIFNTDAYEMPSGSVLLELVRRLPGLSYANGTLTYLGRSIDEIRLNGDTFFKHDINIALKNMPNDKLKKLKIYEVRNDSLDMNSEKHLVMDMQTDKPYTQVAFYGAEGGTTEKFDSYKLSGSTNAYLKDKMSYSFSAITDNIPPEQVLAYKSQWTYLSGMFNLKGKWGEGEVRPDYTYRHNKEGEEVLTQTFTPDFTQYSEMKSFSDSQEKNGGGMFGLNGAINPRLRWQTSGYVRITENVNKKRSSQEMYGEDNATEQETVERTRLNGSENSSTTCSKQKSFSWNGTMLYNSADQKSEAGIKFNVHYGDAESTTYDMTETRYFQLGDSVSSLNRMTTTPREDVKVETKLYFNRKFGKNHHWGVSYKFDYQKNSGKTKYYDMTDGLAEGVGLYAGKNEDMSLVDSLSYRNRERTVANAANANVTFDWECFEMRAGFSAIPTRLSMNTGKANGEMVDTTYSALIFSPQLLFMYKKGVNTIALSYQGGNSLPSAHSLMAVTDYSDPLNIRTGNSQLKKQFTHNLRFEVKTMALQFNSSLNILKNSVQERTLYDPETGVRYTKPDNINGNWNLNSSLNSSVPIGEQTLSVSATHSFEKQVNYMQRVGSVESVRGSTNTHNLGVSANMFYWSKLVSGSLNVSYDINIRNNDFLSYKTNTRRLFVFVTPTFHITENIELFTNMTFEACGGYELKSANKNQFLCDVGAEYKFLKGKRATLRIELTDIFRQKTNFSASMSDTQWTETRRFGKMSYAVLSFSYRFDNMR